MAAIFVEPPPPGHLSIPMLVDERGWGQVVTRQTVWRWFNAGHIKGKQYGSRDMWCCTPEEAKRFERVHPRLRQLVAERAAGGAA